jgi:hypothetical protein
VRPSEREARFQDRRGLAAESHYARWWLEGCETIVEGKIRRRKGRLKISSGGNNYIGPWKTEGENEAKTGQPVKPYADQSSFSAQRFF